MKLVAETGKLPLNHYSVLTSRDKLQILSVPLLEIQVTTNHSPVALYKHWTKYLYHAEVLQFPRGY